MSETVSTGATGATGGTGATGSSGGTAAAAPVPTPVVASNFPMRLDEFCRLQSAARQPVELIAAFEHLETAGGFLMDTAANFQTRWTAMLSRPAA